MFRISCIRLLISADPSTTPWGSTEVARPEEPKGEVRRADRWVFMIPCHQLGVWESAVSSLLVSGAKPQRPGDVGFVGLQSPCDVDVAGNKFYFTGIFVSIRAIKDSTTKLLWGSRVPEPPQDRRLYILAL